MGQIIVEKNVGGIEGLCVITPAVHGDNRGYFMETYSQRDMEENGLVNRKVYAEVPPRVEYSLTELGQSLKPILDAMWSWGEDYKEKCNK